MLWYVLRRVVHSIFTVFGVMVVTFLLFRVMAGQIAAAYLPPHASAMQKAEWHHNHGYDRPWLLNVHRQIVLIDRTKGDKPLRASEAKGSAATLALGLFTPSPDDLPRLRRTQLQHRLLGRYVFALDDETPIEDLTAGRPLVKEPADDRKGDTGADQTAEGGADDGGTPEPGADAEAAAPPPRPVLQFRLSDDTALDVDLSGVRTFRDLRDRIEQHGDNGGRLEVSTTDLRWGNVLNSQFVHHLVTSVTLQARSLAEKRKLTEIIVERAPRSLALMLPAMAIGWMVSLTIACLVAYYRGRWIDHAGVFLSVLGMCVPALAFMIFGQWLMFGVAPRHAYGVYHRANIYVPILILVLAGLGARVRFYRTIILDETNRDYVRTARAKGVPLSGVLFKHILRNCMLPILTNLITMLPFLILGSLLFEQYFGIPGLGDLMLSSINGRDEPILSAMVFLIAAVYTFSVLLTDLAYGLFDPRVHLH